MLAMLRTKIAVPHQLETERLVLRQLCESDWQSLYRYLSDPIATRYTLNKEFSTIEAWHVMCSMIGHWQLRGYGPYAIEHKETKAMMGIAGFWYPLDWPGPEIKWALVREYWGKGFASEAARAILAAGKNSLPNISWISVIHDENLASVRVAEALGGVFENTRTFNNAKWRTYRY
jgi:RimJ/RimL family protein N-acetyltransferase